MVEASPSVGLQYKLQAQFTGEWARSGLYGNIYLVARKRICHGCNTGWMSTLQKNAMPAVGNMIAGRKILLTESAQDAIAGWFTMLAMVLDCVPDDQSNWYFTPQERSRLRTDLEIPAVSTFWLGSRQHKWSHLELAASGVGANFQFVDARAPRFLIAPAHVASVSLFHAVFQLLIYRLPAGITDPGFSNKRSVESPWSDMTVRFGPPDGSLEWPPTPMDDLAFLTFARRWSGAANPPTPRGKPAP